MNGNTAPFWLALLIQLGLGFAVCRANWKSRGNQSFLIVCIFISAWLLSLHLAFGASNAQIAEFWIRSASMSGLLIVFGFNVLRLAIIYRDSGWDKIVRRSYLLGIPTVVFGVLCWTNLFLRSASLKLEPGQEGLVPEAVYGPIFPYYVAYAALAVGAVIILSIAGMRKNVGIRKVELQFIFTGAAVLAVLVLAKFFLEQIFPPFRQRAASELVATCRVVAFTLIVAYGIATRKIMDVGFFLRRLMGYVVLIAYLIALYLLIWWLVSSVFAPVLGGGSRALAHLAAAIVIAFAMAPARGLSQTLAQRLFVGTGRLDFHKTMNQAAAILSSVTTLADLLDRFGLTIVQAIDTERLFILLSEPQFYAQHYPVVQAPTDRDARSNRVELHQDQTIIAYLSKTQEPIILDELHRVRSTPELERVQRQMQSLEVNVAMGIFSREHLAGVMLLGPRRSGRIYGLVEQNALRVLCGQLAVAIENAQLFTEVQNAKIYNETLLQNLTSGVIAADRNEAITVFNHEIEEI
ncbi:MAG: histidine kinase N-terminal 7TM domain-containing protein, partial [Casimicrobiaceae bacterium]